MFNFKTVLVLAPHTDDGEFGAGGTIAKLQMGGARIVYVAFSAAEQSVPPDLPRDILRKEVKDATQVLGIAPIDCVVLDYEVRRFPAFRQEILDDMIKLNRKYQPDLVILPSKNDTHQDHLVVAEEGFRAFKRVTMLAYEVPWNNREFRADAFVELAHQHLDMKKNALNCYKSQMHRGYASDEFVTSLAVTRGTQIGVRYAEMFEVMRWVIY